MDENYYKQGDKTSMLCRRVLLIRVRLFFMGHSSVFRGKGDALGSLLGCRYATKIKFQICYVYDKNSYRHFWAQSVEYFSFQITKKKHQLSKFILL